MTPTYKWYYINIQMIYDTILLTKILLRRRNIHFIYKVFQKCLHVAIAKGLCEYKTQELINSNPKYFKWVKRLKLILNA